jgi:hypothetical protein
LDAAIMSDSLTPEPSEETRQFATYIAMVIRNAMEDFHCQHLSDEQMKQLNPIIRNAVCTAIHAFQNYEQTVQDKRFVDSQFRLIPSYWERPELLDHYLRLWDAQP